MTNGPGSASPNTWADRIIIALVLALGMFLLNEIWGDIGEIQRDMNHINRAIGEIIARDVALDARVNKLERDAERRWRKWEEMEMPPFKKSTDP